MQLCAYVCMSVRVHVRTSISVNFHLPVCTSACIYRYTLKHVYIHTIVCLNDLMYVGKDLNIPSYISIIMSRLMLSGCMAEQYKSTIEFNWERFDLVKCEIARM